MTVSNIHCGYFLSADGKCVKCGVDPEAEADDAEYAALVAQARVEHGAKRNIEAAHERLAKAKAARAKLARDKLARREVEALAEPVQAVAFEVSGPAEIEARANDSTETAPRKFHVQAYNGGALEVAKYDLPIVIDLSGVTPAKSIVANLHHDRTQIVGHVPLVGISRSAIVLDGIVSGTGRAAQEFLGNHDAGFPWQASIECRPSKVDEVPAGKIVEVNGQSFTGPIYVARKSKLYGVAFLPRGADENTSVSISATDLAD
jgi:hypothetical protein